MHQIVVRVSNPEGSFILANLHITWTTWHLTCRFLTAILTIGSVMFTVLEFVCGRYTAVTCHILI